MGSFVEFENSRHLYATLVDGRQQFEKAILLEHPLFHRFTQDKKKVPRVEVDLANVQSNEMFLDPVSELPQGKSYSGNWLACVQAVASPRLSTIAAAEEDESTGKLEDNGQSSYGQSSKR